MVKQYARRKKTYKPKSFKSKLIKNANINKVLKKRFEFDKLKINFSSIFLNNNFKINKN